MGLGMALEDYIETIYLLGGEKGAVRLTDIARRLNVRKSTVVDALKRLQEQGLAIHERYGDVMLTQKGVELASRVYERHITLYRFLSDILGVDDVTASREACDLEHFVSSNTTSRLKKFLEFFNQCKKLKDLINTEFKEFLVYGRIPSICEKKEVKMITLKELKTGEEGVIKKVGCDASIRARLLAMGLVPGERVKVAKIAPMGDPMDIIIKGYHLSLRKDEAKCIEVELE